jgi:hypothetical protein
VTSGRMTLQLGLRYDYISDKALEASIVANPLGGPWLPAITFPGADPGVAFNNFSPRLGFTYDLSGTGKTIGRVNFARYYGQVGNGGIAGSINPVGAVTLRYPWIDANKNGVADVGEPVLSANPISTTGNWSAANPGNATSLNSVDPNLKNDYTNEFIVGLDREIGRGFAVGANYIWRRYGDFNFNDRTGITTADWVATTFTPPAASCPGADGQRISAANCPTITFYSPRFQQPTVFVLSNVPDYNRSYNGIEVTGRKRLGNRWMMNTSFAYNATKVNFNSFPGSQPSIAAAAISEDPSNREFRDGYEYDYLTAGSGLGNVYVNSKWLFKISGLYELPLKFNVSAFYNARQGYPQEISIQTPSCSATVTTNCRGNGANQIDILLNPVGETRLPNFQNIDFHVERPISFGSQRIVPSIDIFNLTNANTVQAIRSRQNATNANQIQAILAPRVIRFGVKVSW